MNKSLELLSQREAQDLMRFYFAQAVPFSFGTLSNGKLAFMLKNSSDLISNKDGSVTWKVCEIGIGLHSFIELVTGEEKKRKIYIPLCLVNSHSRKFLTFLLDTTRDPMDRRYNSKEAEIYVLTLDGRGAKIKVKLESLTTHYVMLQIMPSDFALRYKSQHCPFCRELGEVSLVLFKSASSIIKVPFHWSNGLYRLGIRYVDKSKNG